MSTADVKSTAVTERFSSDPFFLLSIFFTAAAS